MAQMKRQFEDSSKKETVTISLPGKQINSLLKEADGNGLNLSSQISFIISQHLKTVNS